MNDGKLRAASADAVRAPAADSPPVEPAAIARARAEVRAAAALWSAEDVVRLAYLVNLGTPQQALDAATGTMVDEGAEQPGTRLERPPTTAAQWALTGVVAMWRAVGDACGRALPAPGSPHASVRRLLGAVAPGLKA